MWFKGQVDAISLWSGLGACDRREGDGGEGPQLVSSVGPGSISMDSVRTTAPGEKMAVLMTMEYLEERTGRGERTRFPPVLGHKWAALYLRHAVGREQHGDAGVGPGGEALQGEPAGVWVRGRGCPGGVAVVVGQRRVDLKRCCLYGLPILAWSVARRFEYSFVRWLSRSFRHGGPQSLCRQEAAAYWSSADCRSIVRPLNARLEENGV